MTRTLNTYFSQINHLPGDRERVEVRWESPSNIALVKYWGKREGQLPMNPSVSMTLAKAVTQTTVIAHKTNKPSGIALVNNDPNHPFIPKLAKLLTWLSTEVPLLNSYEFEIITENSFPHSTGIASSASGLSAFSLCLVSMLEALSGNSLTQEERAVFSSELSRMGSGSACRSIYGGFAWWGESVEWQGSSDRYACSINRRVHERFFHLRDTILIVSSVPKSVSSTAGHSLMQHHPFSEGRKVQVKEHLSALLSGLESGDFEQVGRISEMEAMTLHALIMTSAGNPILWEPGTISLLKAIQRARKSGLPLFYTIDAGANVHLLYPADAQHAIESTILPELLSYCDSGKALFDFCGEGPKNLRKAELT